LSRLRDLIHEAHRRSLWQVLGIYMVGSWVVLQVVEAITNSAGLPDWTPGFAFVLLMIGFPVVIATAFVQEGAPRRSVDSEEAPEVVRSPGGGPGLDTNLAAGTGSLDRPSTRPSAIKRFLTWKLAIGGGLAASILLAVSVGAYFFMWSNGIGAVGSLEARGVFEQGEVIVLADFSNTSNDESLGMLVTETLRIDLASSPNLNVAEPASVSRVLGLMGRPSDTPLTSELAREVALRSGIKAILEGSVGSAGEGYLLLATIRSASDGTALASLRRTARNQAEVIDAIDGLSQDIREKAGEPLRSIKAEAPLAAVTTSSLRALELFVLSDQVITRSGDWERGIGLLEEAVTLDPDFAMAYRKMSALQFNAGRSSAEQAASIQRAYELGDRLTDRERGLATADYHRRVTRDRTAAIEAFERVLERYPDDAAALNNLSIEYATSGRFEEAEALLDRAVSGPGESRVAHANRILAKRMLRDTVGAREARELQGERYPERSNLEELSDWYYFTARADDAASHSAARESGDPSAGPGWVAVGATMTATVDLLAGRPNEARRHMADAEEYLSGESNTEFRMLAVLDHAVVDLLSGDADAAKTRLRQALDSGQFDHIEADYREWLPWIGTLIWSGDREAARNLLARAGEEISAVQAVWSDELQEWGAAMFAGTDDPRTGVERLLRLRSRRRCDACYGVDVALFADAAGEKERAVAEYERLFWGADPGRVRRGAMPLALRRLGPLYEDLGNNEKAIEWYDRLVTWYAHAEPSQRSLADEARGRIAALTAEAGL
jgi:tetratricopeptide (TPR) repeat protein